MQQQKNKAMKKLQFIQKQQVMNRFILTLLFFASVMGNAYGKDYFAKALKEGRSKGEPYLFINKGALITYDKIVEYARQNNYMIGAWSNLPRRFGPNNYFVGKMVFLPKSELPTYAFEVLSGSEQINFGQLSEKGKALYYFDCSDEAGSTIPLSVKYDENKSKDFHPADRVLWSAKTVDGYIDGTGIGFAEIDRNVFLLIKGTYAKGFPTGSVTYKWISLTNEKSIWPPEINLTQTVQMGNTSDGMASYKVNDLYGFVSTDGSICIKPRYKTITREFADGVAYIKVGDVEIKINKQGAPVGLSEANKLSLPELKALKNTFPDMKTEIDQMALQLVKKGNYSFNELVGAETDFPAIATQLAPLKVAKYRDDFLAVAQFRKKAIEAAKAKRSDLSGYQETQKVIAIYGGKTQYDPEKKLSQAYELDDYYTVCRAVAMKPAASYWGYQGNMPVFKPEYEAHKSTMEKALSICNKGNSVFSSFYAAKKPSITATMTQMKTTLEKSKREYDNAYSAYKNTRETMLKEVKNLTWTQVKQRITRETEWSKGRVLDSNNDFTDSKTVEFNDGITVFLEWKYVNKPGRQYTNIISGAGIHDASSKDDAILQGYKYQKTQKIMSDYPL